MKPTTAVAALLVALITGSLLVPAAEAGDRRYRDGHRADRVASHVVIDKRRHHGMHRVHGKRRHDRHGHRRGHWLGHGYGRAHGRWHSRWRGRGHVRHHQRKYRHRGHRRSSWYGYGVSFELDGIRYHFGERHRR